MQNVHRAMSRISSAPSCTIFRNRTKASSLRVFLSSQLFSTISREGDWEKILNDGLGSWDVSSSWSIGSTKEHFNGEVNGQQVRTAPTSARETNLIKLLEQENLKGKPLVDGWAEKTREVNVMMREPGVRGLYLKDSEKAEMYRLHKENPQVYTVEKLAEDYRIMRQRVHAILWLRQLEEEEEEEKKNGPLDESVELLLDHFPEFFNSHDREFHVASLPYKPDEVHYDILMKLDEMLYQEFVQKMNNNKVKMQGEMKHHKYSRRRPDRGWNITVDKLGPKSKRGNGGRWKFMSTPDGSSRPLIDKEKIYVSRRRRKILT